MKLIAKLKFKDLKDKVIRKDGDEFVANKDRAMKLIGMGFAEPIERDTKEFKEQVKTK